MKRISILLLIFSYIPAMAFHIVGGEIEFITIHAGLYQINIVQYFDIAQTDNPGPEDEATVYIFSNATNELMSIHTLLLTQERVVDYTNVACSIEQLQTSRVVWTAYVELDPNKYADPAGYYIVWERCCRNAGIRNIVNPIGTGMKYVSEIPPLWKDDKPFINSSPILFKPLSDYACVDQLYYIEFTGTDPDGDSLVYSLTTPLNSSAALAVPIPQPKPHPLVFFPEPYHEGNMIPGMPPLTISKKGLLTVTPQTPGLYVFSVLVEEFRKGVKLGHVQRDFQMLVIDGCNPPDPPQVAVKIPNDESFRFDVDTLNYTLFEDKCFEYIVKNVTGGEVITLRAEGVNFDEDISEIFEFNVFPIGSSNDSLVVRVCAPGCPPVRGKPFIVDLIAGDDACPLPQLDTVRMTIEVEPPPNIFPTYNQFNQNRSIPEGDRAVFPISAVDPDGDSMIINFKIPGIDDPALYGFALNIVSSQAGEIVAELIWDTDCSIFDFSELQNFDVFVTIDDLDQCLLTNQNSLLFDLSIIMPPNTNPIVSIPGQSGNEIIISPKEEISFDVFVNDEDGDTLNLRLAGLGFNPYGLGVGFDGATGIGSANSTFSWTASCNYINPNGDNQFTFLFIGDDEDKCGVTNFDTLAFTINVAIPDNHAPLIDNYPDYQLEVNEPFSLDIFASDADDADEITLQFFGGFRPPRSPSLTFEPVSGFGQVSSQLTWQPECTLLRNGLATTYELFFIAFDDNCPVAKNDTTVISFEIVETRRGFDNFMPPNAFSPNGDKINDDFRLSNQLERNQNLPTDNCDDSFEYISIHNRSGKNVFYSEKKDFIWDGGNMPAGVYYYVVKYTVTEYKNYILLIK